MNEQTLKLVEHLAQRLGTTSEYLWGVLIKQSEVQAWISLSSILAFCLFAFCLFLYSKWFYKNYQEIYDNDHEMPHTMALISLSCIAFLWFVASVFDVHSIITVLNNPEYWALKQILEAIK
jgi:hypothetical protein